MAAQATRALKTDCRWVVTATPIQNRLSELFSLFRFLRLYPYGEHNGLEWETKDPEVAVQKLKKLLGFTMLRRLNHILHLPKRTDKVIPLELNEEDQARYNLAKQATVQYLDGIISSMTPGNGYVNAISKINALRMVCNLGCSIIPGNTPLDSTLKKPDMRLLDDAFGIVDELLADEDSTGISSSCTICGVLISTGNSPVHRVASTKGSELGSSKDFTQCRSCLSDTIGRLDSPCDAPASQASGSSSSTKIKALVRDLQAQRQATKRSAYIYIYTHINWVESG